MQQTVVHAHVQTSKSAFSQGDVQEMYECTPLGKWSIQASNQANKHTVYTLHTTMQSC